jgi:hypothetical protein
MPASLTQRWTFTQPSPLGDVSSSYELSAEGLQFCCDAALGKDAQMLRWDAIAQAATAVVDLPAGKGGPDMPRWMPGRLEWLLVSPSGPNARALMRPLPAADARDAIVAAMRERLGSRWVGERLPLPAAQKRFRISGGSDTLKVVGLLLSVLAALFVLLLLLVTLVSALFLLPAGFLLGGWCFRHSLTGLRDALQMANTPTAKVCSAAMGLVELEGRAITERPTAAGVSGRPSVWWDVAVDVWSDDKDYGGWNQVMARHGGSADMLLIEDATGRMPVWLRDADLLLQEHTWETGKHELPERGVALLEGSAFAWHGGKRLRVRETRMEANGPVYVFGTLDEARHLPAAGDERGIARLKHSLRTGAWRNALLRWLPVLVRAPVFIAISYLEMLFMVGHGGQRARQPGDAPPPALAPSAVLVWKGCAGPSLIVSDRRENEAIAQLRKRSLWSIAIGAVILCYCLHELINLF